MKKILLIGASSFVGANIAVYLRKHYRVYGTYATRPLRIDGVPSFRLAITPTAPFQDLFRLIKPDAVIYCAAQTDNQRCEADPQGAMFVNAEAPAFVARTSAQAGARFLFLSTAKVFSGNQGPYTEEDPADPISIYGSTKLRAEEWLIDIENTFLFRLPTIFGLGSWHHHSVLDRVLRDLRNGTPTKYISDEYRSFYSVEHVAKAIGIALDCSLDRAGLYHLASPEKHTYFSFARAVAQCFGVSSASILPIAGSSFQSSFALQGGPRGSDLSLNGNLFCESFSRPAPTLKQGLEALKNRLHLGAQ